MQLLDDITAPNLPYPYEMVFKFNEDRRNRHVVDTYVRSFY
ncbi:unnamed protein product [Lymnaea stagnalis]|uniref:Uncharacterized protein n=1 Tax=Lymnaea stagnalis TaxID=6523 RepID=A0AAV2HK52_LYMST